VFLKRAIKKSGDNVFFYVTLIPGWDTFATARSESSIKRGDAMKTLLVCILLTAGLLFGVMVSQGGPTKGDGPPLGLPPVPVPEDNPQTPAKIALGDKLFHDERFSSTGDVSCATCHDAEKAFTDSPLKVSEGINKLTGTRNAPTVLNAVYMRSQFWDGRSPSLEDQALHPFLNPVEMGLKDHQPILEIVRTDPEYVTTFT
jgi:cytochrome c peroxidase